MPDRVSIYLYMTGNAIHRFVAAAAMVLLPSLSSGQSAGAIDGTVADAAGGALPGVVVTATGDAGQRESVTDATGG
ncbi:MAG: carboxypeptidase regulatory-like domain-containing protein, partial [Chloroflexi bacterium]|nr:carboxypeptidase regulatory-like domain-containing protein [Chloroflexota bacterium]